MEAAAVDVDAAAEVLLLVDAKLPKLKLGAAAVEVEGLATAAATLLAGVPNENAGVVVAAAAAAAGVDVAGLLNEKPPRGEISQILLWMGHGGTLLDDVLKVLMAVTISDMPTSSRVDDKMTTRNNDHHARRLQDAHAAGLGRCHDE